MLFSYLKTRMIEEKSLVLKLLFLDEEIQGFKEDYQEFLTFLDNPIPLHEKRETKDIYLLEGNAKDFARILNDTLNEYKEIFVEETNLGFNKWLYKMYNEYCDIHNINRVNVTFTNYYSLKEGRAIIVGSHAFCEELKSCVNIPSFCIETK